VTNRILNRIEPKTLLLQDYSSADFRIDRDESKFEGSLKEIEEKVDHGKTDKRHPCEYSLIYSGNDDGCTIPPIRLFRYLEKKGQNIN